MLNKLASCYRLGMKILIAEDQQDTAALLSAYFTGKNYQVAIALDGNQALQTQENLQPDLILLDVKMPKMDGWQVLQQLREKGVQTPIIMVTAMGTTEDAVRGLSLGADDYLRKPFDLAELEARVNAVLRRSQQSTEINRSEIRLGDLCIDDKRKEVCWKTQRMTLTPKEYGLLFLLASDPGRVFANNEIIAAIWGKESSADHADVKQYVHLLRTKLARIQAPKETIETVKGFGYRLQIW